MLMFQISVFLLAKNQYYCILRIEMLKIGYKLEFERLTKTRQTVLASSFQKSKRNIKKTSAIISGEHKNIEAQVHIFFYKKAHILT